MGIPEDLGATGLPSAEDSVAPRDTEGSSASGVPDACDAEPSGLDDRVPVDPGSGRRSSNPGSGRFCTTHWTVVMAAAGDSAGDASAALAQLCADYWPPLYHYVRRRGFSPHDAEDITQGFFTRLIEKRALDGLQRDGGRFRSFMLRSMENFVANEWARARTQKRGGGVPFLPLDVMQAESSFALAAQDDATPDRLFERQWVFTLLGHVLDRLQAECAQTGRQALFDDLRPHLQGDRLGEPYAQIAERRGTTEGAIKAAVHRLRGRYVELLRNEIARTVSHMHEVETELRHLMHVVSSAP